MCKGFGGEQLCGVGGLGPRMSKAVGLAQKGECLGKDSPSFVGGEQTVSPQDGSSPGFDSEPRSQWYDNVGTTYLLLTAVEPKS